MKQCLREKCKKEFEPKRPNSKFCSERCRVYHHRETKSEKTPKPSERLPYNFMEELADLIAKKISGKSIEEPSNKQGEKPLAEKNKKEPKTDIEQYWQQRFKKKLS